MRAALCLLVGVALVGWLLFNWPHSAYACTATPYKWHQQQIVDAASGTVRFDLSPYAPGTYLINIDLFDKENNSTYWWEPWASPGQVTTFTRLGEPPRLFR